MNSHVFETTVDSVPAFVWESALVTLSVYPSVTRTQDGVEWGTMWELQSLMFGTKKVFTMINPAKNPSAVRLLGRLIIEGADMASVLQAHGEELLILTDELHDAMKTMSCEFVRISGTKNLRPSVLEQTAFAFAPSSFETNYWFDMNGSNN